MRRSMLCLLVFALSASPGAFLACAEANEIADVGESTAAATADGSPESATTTRSTTTTTTHACAFKVHQGGTHKHPLTGEEPMRVSYTDADVIAFARSDARGALASVEKRIDDYGASLEVWTELDSAGKPRAVVTTQIHMFDARECHVRARGPAGEDKGCMPHGVRALAWSTVRTIEGAWVTETIDWSGKFIDVEASEAEAQRLGRPPERRSAQEIVDVGANLLDGAPPRGPRQLLVECTTTRR